MAVDDFTTVDLLDIPEDLVASDEVRRSGLNIRTLPAGKYAVEVEELKLRRIPEEAQYNPGRLTANFTLRTEENRKLFMDVSWEPPEDSKDGTDSATKLYAQVEQALNMYGEPVRDVLMAAEDASFVVDVIESARVTVATLPDEQQTYYRDTKGLGDTSEVTFYIKAEDSETREYLAAKGAKIKNHIRTVFPA